MADSYTVKVENGSVKLFGSGGEFLRRICGNAVEACVKGDEIHVKTNDNKNKGYSVKGFYKKTL